MNILSPSHINFDSYINVDSLSLKHRRGLILCILYMFEMNEYDISMHDVVYCYNVDYGIIIDSDNDIIPFITELIDSRNALDEELKKYLKNWDIDRISTVIKLILRYGMFELKKNELDSALIINEAIELAKGYAEAEGYRVVNGILDFYSNFLKNDIS